MFHATCHLPPVQRTSLENCPHLSRVAAAGVTDRQGRQHSERIAAVIDGFDQHHCSRIVQRGMHQAQAARTEPNLFKPGTEFMQTGGMVDHDQQPTSPQEMPRRLEELR